MRRCGYLVRWEALTRHERAKAAGDSWALQLLPRPDAHSTLWSVNHVSIDDAALVRGTSSQGGKGPTHAEATPLTGSLSLAGETEPACTERLFKTQRVLKSVGLPNGNHKQNSYGASDGKRSLTRVGREAPERRRRGFAWGSFGGIRAAGSE